MPNPNPFGHALKALLLSGFAVLMTACSTTGPVTNQTPVPVVQRPVNPVQPTPTESQQETNADAAKETESTDKKEDTPTKAVEVTQPTPTPTPTAPSPETGTYFNNRDGLTPPHMAGRDTKRLALLLPFSTSSSRLAQEAQSMYRAAGRRCYSWPCARKKCQSLFRRGPAVENPAHSLFYRSDGCREWNLFALFPARGRSRAYC